jgi:3-hydroxyanthranilate 3,4-dioxygenase
VRILAASVLIFVEHVQDRLRWYCSNPIHKEPTIIREESFHVTDLGTQLKPVIEKWMADESSRVCPHCGTVADAK